MKFGAVAPKEAIGGTAVHTIRQGAMVLKKGTLIRPVEAAALADGMHRCCADGLLGGDRSEFHDAALTSGRPASDASCGSWSGSWRNRSVICAMMATAISAGETAPI